MAINRLLLTALFGMFATASASPVNADTCRLCEAEPAENQEKQPQKKTPLKVEILSGLTFNRAAHTGEYGGRISVSAQGEGKIQGGLVNLGGYAMAGNAIIKGEPGRFIRIDLPNRVQMSSSTGGKIEIVNLFTNLPNMPRLGMDGQLSFSFGGELAVRGNISGKFRGRIPVTAQYE